MEEQGKYLQMIFEKQCKFGIDNLRPSSPTPEKSEAEVTNAISSSPPQTQTEPGPLKLGSSIAEASSKEVEVDPSESQPSKRAKLNESSTESS